MKNSSQNIKKIAFTALALLLLAAVYFVFIHKKDDDMNVNDVKIESSEPEFKKDGELKFMDKISGKTLSVIEIEYADTELKRQQGLMWRRKMDENQGMLFVFDRESELSFWMKNTYIPLDIIYVNSLNQIVTIQANATPFSEIPIPSYHPSKYVVEVNSGYCSRNKIKEGDKIEYIIKK